MAVSFVSASSSWASAASGSVSISQASGYAVGDMLIAFVCGKGFTAGVTTPSGWTDLGLSLNGATASGVDTGSTFIRAFYKISTAIESGVTISVSSATVLLGIMHCYRSTTKNWNTPVRSGVVSATSSWLTLVAANTLSLPVGSFLASCFVSMTDSPTIGITPTYTATGRTFSSFTANPVAAFSTPLGDDGNAVSGYISVSTASNSTAQTLGISTSGASAERGHAYVVQLSDFANVKGNFFPFF
jgi:hypothetical protein